MGTSCSIRRVAAGVHILGREVALLVGLILERHSELQFLEVGSTGSLKLRLGVVVETVASKAAQKGTGQ